MDFAKKKAERETVNRRKARMLSSLATNQSRIGLKAACVCEGVTVITVNPAYASVVGEVNHGQQKGISVDQGAAYGLGNAAGSRPGPGRLRPLDPRGHPRSRASEGPKLSPESHAARRH